jgi:two-component system OmpR family sensor kinase
MFTHSIRWRFQLWLAFLLVCVLTGFGVTVYQLQRVNQLQQLDEELEGRVAALNLAVRGGPSFDRGRGRAPFERNPARPGFDWGLRPAPPIREQTNSPPTNSSSPVSERFDGPPGFRPGPWRRGFREIKLSSEVTSLFDEARTNGFYFAIWSSDGTSLKRSANAPAELRLPDHAARETRTHTRMRGDFREAFQFTELEDCVLTGRSMASDFQARHRFALVLLAAGGAVLAFGLGVGWWLTTRAIRPIEQISAAASRISAGHLSERITVADSRNELGRLADVLNTTFARLKSAFDRQRQFTADAAHELRTPLAVIISEAQTTLARERNVTEYRETVEACLDTAQQMRRLTDSLLELARSDAGGEQIERSKIDLAEIARACVERIRALAAKRGIQIHCDLAAAHTLGNADRLVQVLTNLLTNAIHYNKPKGDIRVTTRSENAAAIVTITDTGQGIAAEDLPQIFERFYRADKSRSRAEGRSGLGLAICKAIIDADGGSIEVSSQLGIGTSFQVRLPAAPLH